MLRIALRFPHKLKFLGAPIDNELQRSLNEVEMIKTAYHAGQLTKYLLTHPPYIGGYKPNLNNYGKVCSY